MIICDYAPTQSFVTNYQELSMNPYAKFKMSYNKFLNKINEDLNIYAQNSA